MDRIVKIEAISDGRWEKQHSINYEIKSNEVSFEEQFNALKSKVNSFEISKANQKDHEKLFQLFIDEQKRTIKKSAFNKFKEETDKFL